MRRITGANSCQGAERDVGGVADRKTVGVQRQGRSYGSRQRKTKHCSQGAGRTVTAVDDGSWHNPATRRTEAYREAGWQATNDTKNIGYVACRNETKELAPAGLHLTVYRDHGWRCFSRHRPQRTLVCLTLMPSLCTHRKNTHEP